MTNGIPVRTRDGAIDVTGAPPGLTPDQANNLVAQLRGLGGFHGTYEEAYAKLQALDAPRNVSDTTRLQQAEGAMPPSQAPQQEASEGPRTNLTGLMGAATRGALPYVGPAVVGAATGVSTAAMAAAAPAMLVTDMIMGAVNRVAGTNFPSTREAFNQLATAAGVESPDSVLENLVQHGVDAVGQAASVLNLAQHFAPAATQLAAPSAAQGAAQSLASNPAQQLSGAFRAPFGAEAGRRTGEAMGMGETGQQVMEVVGGLGADMSSSVMTMPGDRAVREAGERMASIGLDPADARRAIDIGNQQGQIVRRSDIFPPDTPGSRAFQGVIDAFGGARIAGQQQRGRNRFAREVLEEYSLRPGRVERLAPEIAEEFASNRQTAFTRYGNMKQEALETITGAPVDTSATVRFIDDKIEELTALGGINANVNTAASTTATAADAAARNPYQTQISRLQEWRAAFQNNTIEQLERNRANFGEMFIPDRGYQDLGTQEREIVSGLYDTVRNDIGEAIRRGSGGEEAFKNWQEANKAMFDLQRQLNQEVVGNLLRPLQGVDNVAAVARGDVPLEELSREAQNAIQRVRQSPELLEDIFISGTPSQIETVMPFMSAEGRRKALGAMLYEDMRQSIPNVRDLSGNELSRNLQESFNRRNIVMTDVDREVIDGMGLFLDVTKRAEPVSMRRPEGVSQNLPTPPGVTGMALRGMAASTGAFVGTILGGAAVGRNISQMYESPQIRDMLLDLVEAGATSPKATDIAGRIVQILTPSAQRAPLMGMAGVRSLGSQVNPHNGLGGVPQSEQATLSPGQ